MGRYSNPATTDRSIQPPFGPMLGAPRKRPRARLLHELISDSHRTTIAREYSTGSATIKTLADQYRVSDYSIRMILRNAGIPPQRRSIAKEQSKLVVELWTTTTLGVEAIAKRTSWGHANVRFIIAGLERHSNVTGKRPRPRLHPIADDLATQSQDSE